MKKPEKQALLRMGAGGAAGVVLLLPLGGLFNDLVSGGLIAMGPHIPFRLVSSDLARLAGSEVLALVIQLLLYFALGALLGLSTLPFADDGRSLVLRSLAHFAVTAGVLALTVWLLGWAWSWQALAVYLILLGAVYLLIWLARWGGWYAEVSPAFRRPCSPRFLRRRPSAFSRSSPGRSAATAASRRSGRRSRSAAAFCASIWRCRCWRWCFLCCRQ